MGTLIMKKDEIANFKIGIPCCICGNVIESKNGFGNDIHGNICEDCCKSLKEIIDEYKMDKALKGEK